jgi:hypothetical protein
VIKWIALLHEPHHFLIVDCLTGHQLAADSKVVTMLQGLGFQTWKRALITPAPTIQARLPSRVVHSFKVELDVAVHVAYRRQDTGQKRTQVPATRGLMTLGAGTFISFPTANDLHFGNPGAHVCRLFLTQQTMQAAQHPLLPAGPAAASLSLSAAQ